MEEKLQILDKPLEIKPRSYPYPSLMNSKEYQEVKRQLQIELLKMQSWVKKTGQRVIILFEGRDAAGKGGVIKRFMEHMNPRIAKVVALEKPDSYEIGQWYFQRYITHLPSKGEIVLFDRSWYNRAGVEKVMNFCSSKEYMEFIYQTADLERMWTESGMYLFKLWFSVSRPEQFKRFQKRRADRLSRWKLSPIDIAAIEKWEAYTEAKEAMFYYTNTKHAPWTVINADDKKRSRINAMRHVLHHLPYEDKADDNLLQPDPAIVTDASDFSEEPREDFVQA